MPTRIGRARMEKRTKRPWNCQNALSGLRGNYMEPINPHGRITLVGKTGVGKTELARSLLHRMATAAERHRNRSYRIFVLATKPIPPHKAQDFTPAHFPNTTYSEFSRLEDFPKQTGRVIVWKPREEDGQRDPEHYAWFFRRIFFLGKPAQVFVDELGELTEGMSGRRVPAFYHKMCAQGRGLDIGISSGIQDPVYIPREILTQNDMLFAFRLQNPNDRKKLADTFVPQFLI